MRARIVLLGSIALAIPAFAQGDTARARHPAPDAAPILRILGDHARTAFAPASGRIGALAQIPSGTTAAALGLDEIAPGIGRLRGSAADLLAFSDAHPGVHVEIAPPLRPLLNQAGQWVHLGNARAAYGVDGTGILVGVADTGLDVTHPDLLDADGKTRVAWILDLSSQPVGIHPELEDKYGIRGGDGKLEAGAVLNRDDIQAILDQKGRPPTDEAGHGTHVASIAAGSGGGGPYKGIAPGAGLVIARVTRSSQESIENDDLLRGVGFLFDIADHYEKKPIAANLSLGGDFGPHDGTSLWEQALASNVGPDHPGHALVVAAGNSGSIVENPIHQSVHVTSGTTLRVPVHTTGADDGAVEIWVTLRAGASLSIGLDGPDGEWISPIDEGTQRGKNASGYNAGVIYGASVAGSPIPPGSRGAVVIWSGRWPSGTYSVTLKGEGTADLFMQTGGDAASTHPASFVGAVREGTINLPATHPSLIAVGCTVNRPKWTSIAKGQVGLHVPVLDAAGGEPAGNDEQRLLVDGEICWFSSAGPTTSGVPKPEISAPGGVVIAAMSSQAAPGTPGGIFTSPACPPATPGGKVDPRCLQVDPTHAVAVGTSMSAPLVTGTIALLLQRDATLTQDKIVALLQGGAHPFRGPAPFQDQGGPGELDVLGTLEALHDMQDATKVLPSAARSWVTLSADYGAADGSTPLTAILELRTADGQHRADLFEANRLQPRVLVDGAPFDLPLSIVRHGPGVYTYAVTLPRGYGGSSLTLGATFDGQEVVAPKTVPIATDIWTASYPSHAKGGCALAPAPRAPRGGFGIAALALVLTGLRRRHRPSLRGPRTSTRSRA